MNITPTLQVARNPVARTFPAPSQPVPIERLFTISPKAIWAFLKDQPASFWFVCIYLFFEYVRPQYSYTFLLGPPYARIAILLALGSFLMERRFFRFEAPEALLGVFTIIIVASSAAAFDSSTSFAKLPDFLAWVLIYLLIVNIVDTEERFFVFTLSFLIYSFRMAQHGTLTWAQEGFGFRSWGAAGAPGWFKNSGELGIQMGVFVAMTVPVILALSKDWPKWKRWVGWAIAATGITAIVATSSRGAYIGLAAILLWVLLKSRRKVRALLFAVGLSAFVYVITPAEQKTRFQTAGEDETSITRTTMWKQGMEMMHDNPTLGVGYANWLPYHTVHYGGVLGYRLVAHNTFIEAGSELGYTGLFTFLVLVVYTFVVNRRTRKLAGHLGDKGRFIFFMAHGLDGALVGFLASGFFISVMYYPFFWINFAFTVTLNRIAARKLQAEGRTSVRPRTAVAVVPPRRAVRAVR